MCDIQWQPKDGETAGEDEPDEDQLQSSSLGLLEVLQYPQPSSASIFPDRVSL